MTEYDMWGNPEEPTPRDPWRDLDPFTGFPNFDANPPIGKQAEKKNTEPIADKPFNFEDFPEEVKRRLRFERLMVSRGIRTR